MKIADSAAQKAAAGGDTVPLLGPLATPQQLARQGLVSPLWGLGSELWHKGGEGGLPGPMAPRRPRWCKQEEV